MNDKSKEFEALLETNSRLTATIANIEEKNQALESKLAGSKIHQRVFKHSISMQCKFCHVFYPAEIFIDHVKTCTKESHAMRSNFFQIPLKVSIQLVRMIEDDQDNRTYTEYVLRV